MSSLEDKLVWSQGNILKCSCGLFHNIKTSLNFQDFPTCSTGLDSTSHKVIPCTPEFLKIFKILIFSLLIIFTVLQVTIQITKPVLKLSKFIAILVLLKGNLKIVKKFLPC